MRNKRRRERKQGISEGNRKRKMRAKKLKKQKKGGERKGGGDGEEKGERKNAPILLFGEAEFIAEPL